MSEHNDYRFNYEDDDDGVPVLLKLVACVLASGFTLFLLSVFAKAAVDIWTGW